MSEKVYCVYLLTNWNDEVMYRGVTSNLKKRVSEHREKLVKGFTEKYNVKKLVYFEQTGDIYSALRREKQLKNWKREWKNELVDKFNPEWKDLFDTI